MTWRYGRQTPDNNLMRFVARRFPYPAAFLDIGSGSGANATELKIRGHTVFTVDSDPETDAAFHIDIRKMESPPSSFDCVLDINTLCHVENPPFEKIKNWLKPGGIFFSIWPTLNAPKRIEEGKSYTRRASEHDLREWLSMFSDMKVYSYRAPDFLGNKLESWISEAAP